MNAPAEPLAKAAAAFELIPLGQIDLSPTPMQKLRREHLSKDALKDIAASIKEHGVIQPVLVRPTGLNGRYELVAGERRYLGSKAAGVATIPAIVRVLTPLQVAEMQVIENNQREDLHELVEAQGFEELMKVHKLTADQIAEKIGRSRRYVFNRLKFCDLCPEGRKAFYDGTLSSSVAHQVARIPTHDLQRTCLKRFNQYAGRGEPITFRDAAHVIQQEFMTRLVDAPFDPKDAQLLPKAGACTTCPKRTGNQPELFEDIKGADICTDTLCFAAKRAACAAAKLKAAEASGRKVIAGDAAKKIAPHGYLRGYKAIDDTEWVGGTMRKVSALVGKDAETELFQDPKTGDVVEIVSESDIRKAIKAKGLEKAGGGSGNQAYKAAQQRAQRETAVRTKVLEAIRARFRDEKPDRLDAVMVAQAMFAEIWHENRKKVLALWEWADKPGSKAVDDKIAALSGPDLRLFLLDCALVRDVHVGAYDGKGGGRLFATAKRLKISPEKIRKEIAAAARAKKPKAVKK